MRKKKTILGLSRKENNFTKRADSKRDRKAAKERLRKGDY